MLLRMKHYIKNLLIFLPAFFGGFFFDANRMGRGLMGYVCFCMLSSAIYILNDYKDMEKDRNHPIKRNRPLASGRIKPAQAFFVMGVCLLVATFLSIVLHNGKGTFCILLYFFLNYAYSNGLKDYAIMDIVILASGFVIRVIYGGVITDVVISKWLYLVITSVSLYMGLGKRRNELQKKGTDTRKVLKNYTVGFLDKNMYVCAALSIVFYSLWALELENDFVGWTIPAMIIVFLRYSLDVEGNSDGDPVEVIYGDKLLIGIVAAYAASIFAAIYR